MSESASQLSDLSDELLHGERSVLLDGVGAQPWRYSPKDYRAALAQVPTVELSPRAGPQLDARLAPLAQALRASGRAIHEEALFETLLDDLAAAAGVVAPSGAAPNLAGVSVEARGS